MKKHYIDFSICLNCEHFKKDGSSIKCNLNNIILAYSCKYFKETLYINVDSSTLKNINSNLVNQNFDSLIENIDERCPKKIEHLVRYNQERFSLYKKEKSE